jgi:type II secretory ATPase GspE/PulE/Tfp pilus assembly ATPase PilB-like protein/CheY-like chemotaxis protein
MSKLKLENVCSRLSRFPEFVGFVCGKVRASQEKRECLSRIASSEIDRMAQVLEIPSDHLAEYIAEFCELPYYSVIRPEDIRLGNLSLAFCRTHRIIPIGNGQGKVLVVANPFSLLDLVDLLAISGKEEFDLGIADPKAIQFLVVDETREDTGMPSPGIAGFVEALQSEETAEKYPIIRMASNIVHSAIERRASDIHIEPKDVYVAVRFRVDGDMQDAYALRKETGTKLISRFKVLAGMDIAEKRKPQDGSFETVISGRPFKFRLATTSTPKGESLIVRLLDPSLRPKSLKDLGMSEEQRKALLGLANRDAGLILVVGPTGSGKTTTIYSLLAEMNCKTKSLISVEDPVEYRIPHANQQQVNEKAGLTFESLLKSCVRQDPDVLFLGEMRDSVSAKISFDFVSTGHMTLSSMHTSNATTSIFRLERLGVSRDVMADTIVAIVAQRLLKKLCEACKETGTPSDEEIKRLKRFTADIPSLVARPKSGGCPKCCHTGYWGREGIYEIMEFETEIAAMIRVGKPISEIRCSMEKRGDRLISHDAVAKVCRLIFAPTDVYEHVLVEEPGDGEGYPDTGRLETFKTVTPGFAKALGGKGHADSPKSILVVDDDPDITRLIGHLLANRGYQTTVAGDGVEALLHLGRERFDLIISDVNMPHLDGFKLMEMIGQKGIDTPVVFLTAQADEAHEVKGFELGAADYLKKPFPKGVLIARIQKALKEKG